MNSPVRFVYNKRFYYVYNTPKHNIMKRYLNVLTVLLAAVSVLAQSCGNNNSKPATENKTTKDTTQKTAPAETKTEPAAKPAIINIIDTLTPKRIVVCIKDSAASYERIGLKLAQIYGSKLGEVLKKNNLKMDGPPMAWYRSNKAPFFFEAGVPVAKRPAKLLNGAYIKETAADSAVVAHFYGPYNLLSQGYDAIKEWLKDAKKKASAPPFEIYVGDPVDKDGKMMDPYKVRTDIVFPHH